MYIRSLSLFSRLTCQNRTWIMSRARFRLREFLVASSSTDQLINQFIQTIQNKKFQKKQIQKFESRKTL